VSNGNNPVWTFDGLTGAEGSLPYNSDQELRERAMALCAQGAGGHDGGEQPLCDENNYAGEYFAFFDKIGPEAEEAGDFSLIEGAAITYMDETPPNEVKMYNYAGEEFQGMPWVKYGPTHDFIYGHDQGLGIAEFELQIPEKKEPPYKPYYHHPVEIEDKECGSSDFTGCPEGANSPEINLSELPTGHYWLGANAIDAAGNRSELLPEPQIYIDHTPPVIAPFTGSLTEAHNGEVGDGSYILHFEAQDGSESAPQSGVANMEVYVDGYQRYDLHTTCPEPDGVPSSGCFGYSGNWTFNGQEYGAGTHTITVKAKDWVGNVSESKSLTVVVNDANYQPVGPGAVNLATGDYKLSATDVSVAGGTAGLSVSRVFDSRFPARGSGEPLGPGWQLSLPDSGVAEWQSLSPLENGSIALRRANGAELVFTKSGSSYVAPAGWETYTLTEPTTNPVTYKLTDARGDATTFEQPSSGGLFVPKSVVQAVGAGGLNKVTYTFTQVSGVTEPTEMLAPVPAGVSCGTLVKGCRALTFVYASSTTATGEKSNEWGECGGRLSKVIFHAWDQSKGEHGEMTETAVARYAYDSQCRLRAEWDPRISPELKTTYGYESGYNGEQDRVVSMTPPGQETWAFTYGMLSPDFNPGRLMAVTRPNASTALWDGEEHSTADDLRHADRGHQAERHERHLEQLAGDLPLPVARLRTHGRRMLQPGRRGMHDHPRRHQPDLHADQQRRGT
jgi:hypothetical protein